jgi:hypothetical protein
MRFVGIGDAVTMVLLLETSVAHHPESAGTESTGTAEKSASVHHEWSACCFGFVCSFVRCKWEQTIIAAFFLPFFSFYVLCCRTFNSTTVLCFCLFW